MVVNIDHSFGNIACKPSARQTAVWRSEPPLVKLTPVFAAYFVHIMDLPQHSGARSPTGREKSRLAVEVIRSATHSGLKRPEIMPEVVNSASI